MQMHVKEKEDGEMEIIGQQETGKTIIIGRIGRSTFAGETVISLDGKDFYLFIYDGQRVVAPISKGDFSWYVGSYNHNQVDIGGEEVKMVQEPNQIKLFDRITYPLSILEGLDKQLLAVIPDREMWRQTITEIFREESLELLKQLLRLRQ